MTSQVLRGQATRDARATAWISLLRAHAALTRELSGRLEQEHGLTLSDYDVLVQLYRAPKHRMRRVDIARSVLLTASGVTRLLDGLQRGGWVAKQACEEDARVTWAVLTGEGRRKFEAARTSHLADVEELFNAHFDEAELGTLEELLGRLPLAPISPACQEEST